MAHQERYEVFDRIYEGERHKHIRKYMILEEVYQNEFDWELLKCDCGMPKDANICGIGPNCVKFGRAVNVGEVKEFRIDMQDKRYWIKCSQSILILQVNIMKEVKIYFIRAIGSVVLAKS